MPHLILPNGTVHPVAPPASHASISDIAVRALKDAQLHEVIPTPVDLLLERSDLTLIREETAHERATAFLRGLSGKAARTTQRALNRVLGAVNRKKRAIWVKKRDNEKYERHTALHEGAHVLIPWQTIDSFADTNLTLDPETKEMFEREANFCAGELQFHAGAFGERSRQYAVGIEAMLMLADEFGATYTSAFWKYVDSQEGSVALLVYSARGRKARQLKRVIVSSKFAKDHSGFSFPRILAVDAKAIAAEADQNDIRRGSVEDATSSTRFLWESWTNTYDVFVLVTPSLRPLSIGSILRSFSALGRRSITRQTPRANRTGDRATHPPERSRVVTPTDEEVTTFS